MLTQLLSNINTSIPPYTGVAGLQQLDNRSSHSTVAQSVGQTSVTDTTKNRIHIRYSLHQYKMVIIGRDDACHISLPISKISRQHCRVYWHRGGYVVEDLFSKNGTYVNGEPCNRQKKLEDGDEIQIGFGAKLLFESNQLQVIGNMLL